MQADAAPEVGDEVVVGYELGDSNVNRPYVLGTVYNEPLAEEGDSAEPKAKLEIGGLRAGSSEVLDAGGNDMVLDDTVGSAESGDGPFVVDSFSFGVERNEVGIDSLEVQHEGFEQDTGYFDGRLLSARDLAAEQSPPEHSEATSGRYLVTNATHQAEVPAEVVDGDPAPEEDQVPQFLPVYEIEAQSGDANAPEQPALDAPALRESAPGDATADDPQTQD